MAEKLDEMNVAGSPAENDNLARVSHCRGVWNEDFNCVVTDENVFRFLNCFVQRPLTDFIAEKDMELFTGWWKRLSVGKKSNIFLTLKKPDGEERSVYIIGKRNEDNQENITLELIDVYVAAEEFNYINDEYAKIISYFEHYEGNEYEYDYESKTMRIFKYVHGKKVPTTDSGFLAVEPELADRFEKMLGTPDFIHEAVAHDGVEYSVDGVAIYKDYALKNIFGRIRKKQARSTDEGIENTAVDKLESFTGLWNKVSALEYLRERIETGDRKQVIAAIIDLDYFKIINDTYGHGFGDEVILRMSQILKNVVCGRGIAARFGGDEFMLVLEDIGTEMDLRSIIESVRTQLSWAFSDKVQGQRISCTIGIAEYPRNGKDFDTIFNKADRALYIGKQKGKNRYIIYKEHMHGELPTSSDEKSLEQGIKDSLNVGKQLQGMSWCFEQLCTKGTAAIKDVCERLLGMYIVDRISIYTGKDLKLLDSYGKAGQPLPSMSMVNNPEVLTLFDDDGVCHVLFNHMNSFFFEDFHGALHKSGIYETTIFMNGTKRKIRSLVCYDRVNVDRSNSKKWSDEELHMLLLITQLMSNLLTR